MSSKPEAQNEPTMEEILASIRRIISEDEPQGGKPADEIPPATPPAAAKAQAEPAAAAPAPAESAPLAGSDADNILELTKMVAPDGSIVDLAAEPEAPAVEEPADEAPAEDFAEEEEPAAEAAAADQFDAMPDVHDEATGPELLTPASGDLSEEGALEEEDDTPEDDTAAEGEPEADEPEADEPGAEADESAAQVPAPASDGSDFVSAVTAAAATASLAAVTKAAVANRQGSAVAIGGGRTLEELVRESLAPELKGWLDDNLPDLVERIVREEIRKMVRRAEDQ